MAFFKKKKFDRLLLVSDLHGSNKCFRKLLNAIKVYDANAAFVSGDLTGKMVIPLVRDGSRWISRFLDQEHVLETEEERASFVSLVSDSGFYPYESSKEEMQQLESDPAAAERIFDDLMVARMREWAALAEERIGGRVPIAIVPGNDDPYTIDPVLEESNALEMVDGRSAPVLDRYQVVGLGASNVTPWRAPRDLPEHVLSQKIATAIEGVDRMDRAIFLFHCPPQGTPIDQCIEIDEDLRPVAGGTRTIHAGSTAIREAILEHQPLLSLHGHIHESPGVTKLGNTLCVNAGSEYTEGTLRAAVIQVSEESKPAHLFVAA